MAHNLFESPLESIRVSDLEGFLAEAEEDEGINWEAKCDDPREALGKDAVRKAVCAFANGRMVGVVLVGAEYDKTARAWRLPGLRRPPSIALKRWLDQVVSGGLYPVPEYDLRTFRGAGERGPVAILRVRPLAIKPAVTISGGIYVRTMTQSIPLKDPALIADLFRQGEAERKRAEDLSNELLTKRITPDPLTGRGWTITGYRICVCPAEVPADLPVRVHQRGFAQEVLPNALRAAWDNRLVSPMSTGIRGDRAMAWFDWIDQGELVIAEVYREGAIVVKGAPQSSYDRPRALELLRVRGLARQHDLIRRLVPVLRLRGPAFITHVVMVGADVALSSYWTENDPVPTAEEVAAATRDLLRHFGEPEWEPD